MPKSMLLSLLTGKVEAEARAVVEVGPVCRVGERPVGEIASRCSQGRRSMLAVNQVDLSAKLGRQSDCRASNQIHSVTALVIERREPK